MWNLPRIKEEIANEEWLEEARELELARKAFWRVGKLGALFMLIGACCVVLGYAVAWKLLNLSYNIVN